MDDHRCKVLSPIKYRGRTFREGIVMLTAAIAAEQQRKGTVMIVSVEPAVNLNPSEGGSVLLADVGEPAGGLNPSAGNADAPPLTNTPESKPAIHEAGRGDSGAAVTTEPAGGSTPPAGEAQSGKPKKAAK